MICDCDSIAWLCAFLFLKKNIKISYVVQWIHEIPSTHNKGEKLTLFFCV